MTVGSQTIAFVSATAKEGWQIWMQDTNGEHLRQLTHRNGLYGPLNWSPDGRHLAFLFFPNDADLALSLYIMKPDGADFQLLGKNVFERHKLVAG